MSKDGDIITNKCGISNKLSDTLAKISSSIKHMILQLVITILFDLENTWKHGILKDLHDMDLEGGGWTFT